MCIRFYFNRPRNNLCNIGQVISGRLFHRLDPPFLQRKCLFKSPDGLVQTQQVYFGGVVQKDSRWTRVFLLDNFVAIQDWNEKLIFKRQGQSSVTCSVYNVTVSSFIAKVKVIMRYDMKLVIEGIAAIGNDETTYCNVYTGC